MIFWPCCCSSCFKPCDCFLRNCELHITSEGWTDNAATDCAGIADRVFNKTHVITGMNVTSGPEYGFTCDFTISYDDLILTKLPGGGCICKAQPALYVIEGTLACARGEDGDYGLSMVLHFKVPVYDENEGCSPSPCVLEPKWETWTANYTLISGNLTSNPICDFGANGLGPYSFNTEPSAQTTCGLGLDGTDATVTLEWKFCDPPAGGGCIVCCQEEDFTGIQDTVQVAISGMGGAVSSPGISDCADCSNFDGTYILERSNGGCFYTLNLEASPCDDEWGSPSILLSLSFVKIDTKCYWILTMTIPSLGRAIGIWVGSDGLYGDKLQCLGFTDVVLEPISPSDPILGLGLADVCDFYSSTATITALP